jgi:hypothetical protein
MTERDKFGIHDTQMMLNIMISLLLCRHKYMNPQFSDLANELEDTKTDNQEPQIDEGQTTQCPKEKRTSGKGLPPQ